MDGPLPCSEKSNFLQLYNFLTTAKEAARRTLFHFFMQMSHRDFCWQILASYNVKSSLTSEYFSLWLQSLKKRCRITEFRGVIWHGFWPRFYIVVVGIVFFITLHLLFPISIWTFNSYFYLDLFPFSIWTFFPFFYLYFFIFNSFFHFFPFLFYRGHILDFFQMFFEILVKAKNFIRD